MPQNLALHLAKKISGHWDEPGTEAKPVRCWVEQVCDLLRCASGPPQGTTRGSPWASPQPVRRPAGDRFLTLLGLAGVLAGFVLTALARARKVGDRWGVHGAVGDLGDFGLIMVAAALSIAAAA
jgi:hypothetical protein